MSQVIVLAGSIRRQSWNQKLARAAAAALESAGLGVTPVDLADYPLPIYNGDLEREEGIPDNARRLKEVFGAHDGLLLACPEYNSSITPLLKNTIDWLSRRSEGEAPLAAFRGKIAGLTAASPGALGGLRGLVHVRSILGNLGVWVAPTQVALSKANSAFDEAGSLTDDAARKRLDKLIEELDWALAAKSG